MPTPQPERALVRNAADPRQVRAAEQLDKRRAERWTRAVSMVMSTPDGRAFVAGLIRRAGVHQSCIARDVTIHHLAAVQNHGLELMADLIRHDEELYYQMEREERAWQKAQDAAIDAAHTSRAVEKTEHDHGR
jgi:hypothetical protein